MLQNKKYTIALIAITLLVIVFGLCKGIRDFKENTPAASQNIEQCIILIQGSKYDVTEFRNKHGGGDIFKCGEDMTEAFQKKHKGYLPMIEQFKVDK